jgi:ectoine hydroxylase-related dioxygenase (phytanoyl-CoA dioxygenase family)
MGNIKHGLAGEQAGADIQRVEQALQKLPLVYCEMDPGSALFFHSNLLHASAQNTSENSRWSLISCYTAEYNLPFKPLPHPAPQVVEIVPDSAIMDCGPKGFSTSAQFLSSRN